MRLDKNLREFVELLNVAHVEYLIVGAYAVAFHGHPRQTGDIDFFLSVHPKNAAAIIAVIERFGFASLGLSTDDFLTRETTVQLGYPPNRIDLITGIDGVSFEDAWATRVAGTLDDVPVYFISREALVRNKVTAARPKDLGDVDALRQRQGDE